MGTSLKMMKYDDFINNILKSRPNIRPQGIYMERHHIIPKCLGGNNKKENLIYLTPQEHFKAHQLLSEENPENNKLRYAYWNMCQCLTESSYIPSPEEYEKIRLEVVKNLKGEGNPNFGNHLSEDARKAISEKNKGRKLSTEHINKLKEINSKPFSQEHKNKISESKKKAMLKGEKCPWWGRKHSEETKNKMRKNNLGENNPRYGYKMSLEERRAQGKKVINIDTGKWFYTLKEATDFYNISNKSGISACLKGHQKTAGGYHWEYYTGELING